jgi:hypothetical protein
MADAEFGIIPLLIIQGMNAKNAEDVNAHLRFFQAAQPKNPSATSIRENYFKWYTDRSWYEDNFGPSDSRLEESKSQVAAFNAANGDVLSFAPRKMTAEDEAFIKSLQDQGSFTNAVARDVRKVSDTVAGTGLTPTGKVVRYGIILGGIGLAAYGVKIALSALPAGRIFDIIRKR